jgi:nucleoside-diphosphate-sugar epimerase
MAPGFDGIRAAGGLEDGEIGTDAMRILNAIREVDQGDGVAVLCDLGSAIMSAEAAIELMEADPARLIHRNGFNVAAMSFDPDMIFHAIKKLKPGFEMVYDVDPLKQSIAESWPDQMDDSCARREWGWQHEYNLPAMTKDMLEKLEKKLMIVN